MPSGAWDAGRFGRGAIRARVRDFEDKAMRVRFLVALCLFALVCPAVAQKNLRVAVDEALIPNWRRA